MAGVPAFHGGFPAMSLGMAISVAMQLHDGCVPA